MSKPRHEEKQVPQNFLLTKKANESLVALRTLLNHGRKVEGRTTENKHACGVSGTEEEYNMWRESKASSKTSIVTHLAAVVGLQRQSYPSYT
jgi:hypothetical protein